MASEGGGSGPTSAMDGVALLAALLSYRRSVVALVREELRRWEATAETIPDRALRGAALSALREKGANAEATAVFGILAPRRWRATAVRAMTALQTAVDYLDTLGEWPADDPLACGLALHEALVDALTPGGARADWYRCFPHRDDGNYLGALVDGCRGEVASLPGYRTALPAARRAAQRCGEGQSHTHAAFEDEGARLRGWAESLAAGPGYRWWETAAGACSSVATHALIAAAADPRATTQAAAIDAAYFPPIGALTVLLDDLVDREADLAAGEHNYLTYYPSAEVAAERLAFLSGRARAAMVPLRRRHRHAAILAGVAAFYLSSPDAASDYASPIRSRILESLGVTARLALTAVRFRGRG